MVRIRIGPMPRVTFAKFLPAGDWHVTLREICRFFSRDEFVFEVQLVLDRGDVPMCELDPDADLQLGWTTWLKSRLFKVLTLTMWFFAYEVAADDEREF